MMLGLIDMTSHDGDNLSLRHRRTDCKMSDNYLSRICLYKCMGRHKSCMNNSWIIQNPKYHKYRIPFFEVLATSLSSPGIGYLGHKMRVYLTIGLVYTRIWHPSMTDNPPQHTPASQFSTIHQKKKCNAMIFYERDSFVVQESVNYIHGRKVV